MAIAGCGSESSSDESGGSADDGDGGNEDTSSGDGDSGDGGGGGGSLEIVEDEFYEEDMGAGVRGVVQNNGDEEIAYVEVKAEFLDSEGTRIGDGLANTSDLGAGQKWEFDAAYLDTDSSEVEDYQIEVTESGF